MIAAFIAEKMNAYIAGGMSADRAARFALDELRAVYKGDTTAGTATENGA